MWHNFGVFCLRSGDFPLAEQCLREALALDPSQRPSRLALGCLLWHLGSAVDPCFLADAESPLFAAANSGVGGGVAWALLGLVKRQRDLDTDARNCASRAAEVGAKEPQPYCAHLEVRVAAFYAVTGLPFMIMVSLNGQFTINDSPWVVDVISRTSRKKKSVI